MSVDKRIRALRIQNSMTQQELGDLLDVSALTVRNWELGYKKPSMNSIVDLAKIFHTSTDSVLGVVETCKSEPMPMTRNESALLSSYRVLDDYGKRAVDAVIRIEKQRVSDSRNPKTADNSNRSSLRTIPKYTMPSAAGYSFPFDDEDSFEMIYVGSDVPSDADFAVCIQGDSMLPLIHDGDTVYVKRNAELSIGDVGIFSVDGALYCKQYYLDEQRNLTLVSANPDLRHTNVFVGCDEEANVVCFGKVLLGTKTPLPDYFR